MKEKVKCMQRVLADLLFGVRRSEQEKSMELSALASLMGLMGSGAKEETAKVEKALDDIREQHKETFACMETNFHTLSQSFKDLLKMLEE